MEWHRSMGETQGDFLDYAAAVGDAFLTLDADGTIRRADGLLSSLGLPEGPALLGRSFSGLLAAEARERLERMLAEHRGSLRIGPVLLAIRCPDGGSRETVAFFARPAGGAILRVVLAAAGRFRRFAADLVAPVLDEDGFIQAVAAAAEGDGSRTVSFIEHPGTPDRAFARDLLRRAAEEGATVGQLSPTRFAVLHEEGEGADAAARFAAGLKARWGDQLSWAALTIELQQLKDPNGRAALKLLLHRVASEPDLALEELHLDRGLALLADAYREVEAVSQRIMDRRFDLVYQPIVALADGSIHHHEALLRVPGEDGPGRFIGIAEQSGLIRDLDFAVVDKLLRRIKGLGPQADGVMIAANLSARSLLAPGFVDRLLKRLDGAGAAAGHLLFEVTESARIDNVPALAAALARLKEAGHAICLDDFGAGMSGFQYLRDLPVDLLKIDGSYVKGAPQDPRMREFLEAILSLARRLKIPTIAEWIENEEEAAFLSARGVAYGQGFHFGRPSPKLVSPRTRRAS